MCINRYFIYYNLYIYCIQSKTCRSQTLLGPGLVFGIDMCWVYACYINKDFQHRDCILSLVYTVIRFIQGLDQTGFTVFALIEQNLQFTSYSRFLEATKRTIRFQDIVAVNPEIYIDQYEYPTQYVINISNLYHAFWITDIVPSSEMAF